MKKKRITLILAALTAISLLITLTACGNGNSASETASDVSSFEETASAESTLSSETESEINSEAPIENMEEPTEQQANTTVNNTNTGNNTTYTPPSNGGGNNGSNTNTGGNSGGNTNTGTTTPPQQQQQTVAPTQPQPTVHQPIYRQQWVVDQAAWSEEVPVWGNKYIEVCNTCGADITGQTEHIEEHLLKGEGGSYRSEVIKVQTGTRTIFHEEVGHWESVLVCGGCTGTH